MSMEIQNKKVGNKGTFYIEKDKKIFAEMIYNMPSPDRMIIEHTEVDDTLKGKNIGKQLVHHMIEYARTNNIKAIPLCRFTILLLKEHRSMQICLINHDSL